MSDVGSNSDSLRGASYAVVDSIDVLATILQMKVESNILLGHVQLDRSQGVARINMASSYKSRHGKSVPIAMRMQPDKHAGEGKA